MLRTYNHYLYGKTTGNKTTGNVCKLWFPQFVLLRITATEMNNMFLLHLQTQLQDGSRLTFFYISFSSFTFPGALDRIFFRFLPWLPCHFYLVVIEIQHGSELLTFAAYRDAIINLLLI